MAVQGLNGYPDFDKWKLGLNQTQQPPVEPSYEIKDPFGLNAYGGVTEFPQTYGLVQGTDGTMIRYANSQGRVGCSEVATSPFAGNGQAGYSEKPGFEPVLKNLFG